MHAYQVMISSGVYAYQICGCFHPLVHSFPSSASLNEVCCMLLQMIESSARGDEYDGVIFSQLVRTGLFHSDMWFC